MLILTAVFENCNKASGHAGAIPTKRACADSDISGL